MYMARLGDIDGITVHTNPTPEFDSNFWLSTILIDHSVINRTPDELRVFLLERGIETRLLWRPMHMQPVFSEAPFYGDNCAERLFESGLCLPSGSILSDDEINKVIDTIIEAISGY